MYTLEYFLKTGNLGKIKLYSTLNEVESILGKTDLILEIQTNIFTLKYDYLQLTFQENTVRKINILVPDSCCYRESSSCLDKILSKPWTLTTMNLEQFIELLNSYETIPKWEIDTKSSVGTSLFIIINNKVKVYCDLSWGCQISEIFVEGDIYYSRPI